MRWALVLAFAACTTARRVEPPARAAPYCFAVLAKWGKGLAVGTACSEHAQQCEFARGLALKFSGWIGLKEVGQCHRSP